MWRNAEFDSYEEECQDDYKATTNRSSLLTHLHMQFFYYENAKRY